MNKELNKKNYLVSLHNFSAPLQFFSILFQAHQELVKVKKMIDRKGFEKKKAADKDQKDSKSVKFADVDNATSNKNPKAPVAPSSNASSTQVTPTSALKSSPSKPASAASERVNSRWVTPISKPQEAVSKKPMRRIKIEEVG